MVRRGEGFDEHGNPIGRAFDLGGVDDERLRGERILLYGPGFVGSWTEVMQAVKQRHLNVDLLYPEAVARPLTVWGGRCPLDRKMLASYSQLWLVSGDSDTLSSDQVTIVCDFVRAGNGLFITADNEPLFADANLVARALIGTHFSGNKMADKLLVPGNQLRPGVFVEHPLTQGLNQLYEGVTICTIAPAQHVKILAISHDGQNCMACYERDKQRAVLDTGFTKFHNGAFLKTAGTARYLRNIAFWLARGVRDLEYKSFTPGRESLATINPGGTSERYKYTLGQPTALTYILHWEGAATLGLVVQDPSGRIIHDSASATAPIRVEVPTATVGDWVCWVKGISVPRPGFPYVLTLVQRKGAVAPAAVAPAAVTPVAPAPRPATASGEAPVYLVVDGSQKVSDIAPMLEAGVRRLAERLRSRPVGGLRPALSLLVADAAGRKAVPLMDAARFIAPSLRGQGSCGLGAALTLLLRELAGRPPQPKPLVALFLAGSPANDWHAPADQLRTLASQGKANVFAFGVGGYADAATLRRLTPMPPLALSMVTPANVEQLFDWLYGIADVMLSGMESGASGQRSVPPPPACLWKIV